MDLGGLLHQRRVAGRELALAEIDVVLQPDAHMAAEQHRLGHHGKLVERDAEGKPTGIPAAACRACSASPRASPADPGDTEADLEHARRLDVPGLDHALGEQQMPGLEHFEFGTTPASRIATAIASR